MLKFCFQKVWFLGKNWGEIDPKISAIMTIIYKPVPENSALKTIGLTYTHRK